MNSNAQKAPLKIKLNLQNPVGFSYHISRIPDVNSIDPQKTQIREDQGKTIKINTEINQKAVSFTGKQQFENDACYLAFVKNPNGEYTVIPIKNWYTSTKDIQGKTMSLEEAEKIVNFFKNSDKR